MGVSGNLSQIQAYLESQLQSVLKSEMAIEDVMSEVMSQAVQDVVYASYTPYIYERRGLEGGLADQRQMVVTDVLFEPKQLRLLFENLTMGNDSMSNEYIADMIEEGLKDSWSNPDGIWSEKREFIKETADRLRQNPDRLINAIRKGLISRGFKLA